MEMGRNEEENLSRAKVQTRNTEQRKTEMAAMSAFTQQSQEGEGFSLGPGAMAIWEFWKQSCHFA